MSIDIQFCLWERHVTLWIRSWMSDENFQHTHWLGCVDWSLGIHLGSTIRRFNKCYNEEGLSNCSKYDKIVTFDLLKTTSQLKVWNLSWQCSWFAIANEVRQLPIESNGQCCFWSWNWPLSCHILPWRYLNNCSFEKVDISHSILSNSFYGVALMREVIEPNVQFGTYTINTRVTDKVGLCTQNMLTIVDSSNYINGKGKKKHCVH